MSAPQVICDYCQGEAELVDSSEVYSRSYGPIWLCRPCRAWVGVHKNSNDHKPLGRLADAELRDWKKRAHAAFDPLWQKKIAREGCSKGKARSAGYKWLADEMGIAYRYCHIGMFDIEQCRQVVGICAKYRSSGGAE